ncbi:MAG TPA: hypothetical protein VLQ47_05510 [Rhodoferax sp.]|nr:hypothetical protein [Rhodoferax sp.]
MYTASTAQPEVISARGNSLRSLVSARHPVAHQMQTGPPLDWQYIAMLDAYRESGGLMRSPELASMWRSHGISGTDLLAHWILKRKVISFEWQSTIWLPMVQFNRSTMTLVPWFEEIQAELVAVFNDSDVAQWFSLPNSWLSDRSPANALVSAAPEVLLAARAERHGSAH